MVLQKPRIQVCHGRKMARQVQASLPRSSPGVEGSSFLDTSGLRVEGLGLRETHRILDSHSKSRSPKSIRIQFNIRKKLKTMLIDVWFRASEVKGLGTNKLCACVITVPFLECCLLPTNGPTPSLSTGPCSHWGVTQVYSMKAYSALGECKCSISIILRETLLASIPYLSDEPGSLGKQREGWVKDHTARSKLLRSTQVVINKILWNFF